MRICLLRHAPAVARGAPGDDAERPLTPRGERRARAAGAGLHLLGVEPDCWFASPLARAAQTARLARRAFRHGSRGLPALLRLDALGPERDPAELIAILWDLRPRLVVCVGHAPHLDRLLLTLLGTSRGRLAKLGKGGAALLSFRGKPRPGRGRLEWHLPPAVLQRLGGRT